MKLKGLRIFKPKPLHVGLVVIATNKYVDFVNPLYESMQRFFLHEPDVVRHMFLFTNQPVFEGPIVVYQKHESWPNMTLKRYEIFDRNREVFKKMDYLYYSDVDMVFREHVGKEVLGERVVTVHPGFWASPRCAFPYESNPQSTAYVGPDEGDCYFAGGFNGGEREVFLEMARVIAARVNQDLENGYIAAWHDESHLNRYMIDHRPTVILNPSYCFPEADWAQDLPFRKVLQALNKDHDALRTDE